MGQTWLKIALNHLSEHPKWSQEQLSKELSLTPFGPTGDPRKPTRARAPRTLVVPIGHRTVLTALNYVASDPFHPDLPPQACPTHSMAIKHTTGRWKLKKYAKMVLFKVDFVVFWAPKEGFWATIWVQNTLDNDQTCLFVM